MADYKIWPATDGPASFDTDVPISCGVEFQVTDAAWAKEIRFFRGTAGITGSVTGQLYTVDGPASGTPVPGTSVSFVLSGTGWQVAEIVPPVELVIGQNYKAVVHFPANYTATGGYWESGAGLGGITNGILSAPDTFTSTDGQCNFTAGGSITYPVSSFHGGNFWIDVTVTDDPPGDVFVGSGEVVFAVEVSGAGAKTVPRSSSAALALSVSGSAAKSVARSGTAAFGVAVSGAGSKSATRAGAASFALAVSGEYATTRTRSGSASVALTVIGAHAKRATRAGTALFTITVTGVSGESRDITITARALPSRWTVLPLPSRWTIREATGV